MQPPSTKNEMLLPRCVSTLRDRSEGHFVRELPLVRLVLQRSTPVQVENVASLGTATHTHTISTTSEINWNFTQSLLISVIFILIASTQFDWVEYHPAENMTLKQRRSPTFNPISDAHVFTTHSQIIKLALIKLHEPF